MEGADRVWLLIFLWFSRYNKSIYIILYTESYTLIMSYFILDFMMQSETKMENGVYEDMGTPGITTSSQIGRASCRERV